MGTSCPRFRANIWARCTRIAADPGALRMGLGHDWNSQGLGDTRALRGASLNGGTRCARGGGTGTPGTGNGGVGVHSGALALAWTEDGHAPCTLGGHRRLPFPETPCAPDRRLLPGKRPEHSGRGSGCRGDDIAEAGCPGRRLARGAESPSPGAVRGRNAASWAKTR